VRPDRFDQVGGPAIVQQEDPLPEPPQGCRPELVSTCDALDDVVGQPGPHSMEEHVGEEVDRSLTERRARGASRGQRGRVTQGAADLGDHATATSARGVSAAGSGGARKRMNAAATVAEALSDITKFALIVRRR